MPQGLALTQPGEGGGGFTGDGVPLSHYYLGCIFAENLEYASSFLLGFQLRLCLAKGFENDNFTIWLDFSLTAQLNCDSTKQKAHRICFAHSVYSPKTSSIAQSLSR